MSRVFIIGSGFSTRAGAPLSRSVLGAIFAPDRRNSYLDDLEAYLRNFLFQGRPDWIGKTHLEEVLSRLDLIRHYKPYPDVNYDRVSHYEELLLAEFTELLSPKNIDGHDDTYKKFGDYICPEDTLISFNYDLVIEDLLRSSRLKYNYHLSSGQTRETKPSVDLLKLHGSINLYYCPACSEIFFLSCLRMRRDYRPKCQTCLQAGRSSELRHFMIAPTLFKSYTLPALRNLWFMALKALSGARSIFFIGYSLPEADILSYQLFDYARRLSSRPQKVFLINGSKSGSEKFKQLYGSNLHDEGLYFEEWAAKLPPSHLRLR